MRLQERVRQSAWVTRRRRVGVCRRLLGGVLLAALLMLPQGCGLLKQLFHREEYKPILAPPRPAPAEPAATPKPTPPPRPQPVVDQVARPGNPAAWGEAGQMGVGREFDAVYFTNQSTELDAAAKQRVAGYVEWLRAHPQVLITLVGYADRGNPYQYSYSLGMARALAVADAMIGAGLEKQRIFSTTFGKDRPAAEGVDPQADALNNRVEVLGFVPPPGLVAPPPAGIDKGEAPEADAPEVPPAGRELTR